MHHKKKDKISVILLSGGIGSRMNSSIPKQYLPLNGKPIILHCFEVFRNMPEVEEIIVVCAPEYQHLFQDRSKHTRFAQPGETRQESVYNGFEACSHDLICIHDGARPLITAPLVRRALDAAQEHGAATVGMPVKFTIKESGSDNLVKNTPDRSTLWEIQTPQVIHSALLKQGFTKAQKEKIPVTDDVSLVELLNLPVKLVEGHHANIKITTAEDIHIAEHLLEVVVS